MSTDRLTVCLDLSGIRPSQHTNYNFKSMCSFNGMLIGANEDGLFKLDDGDRDDASDILAYFRLSSTDFGLNNQKRLRKILMGYRTDGSIRVSISPDGKDDVSNDIVPSSRDLRETGQEVPIGRDVRGRYLELEVRNIDGSDFTVDSIYAVPIVLGIKPR